MNKSLRKSLAGLLLAPALMLIAAGGANAERRAFIWDTAGGMRDIPVSANPYSYSAFSYSEAINDHGVVIGWGSYDWMWDSLGGEICGGYDGAVDINDHGDVIGFYPDYKGGWTGYLTGPAGSFLIGKLPGDAWADTQALNNNCQVVGYSGDGAHGRPYIWDKTNGIRLLALPEGFSQGSANAINDLGVVAGEATRPDYTSVAVYWTSPSDVHILGPTGPGSDSDADGINISGQVAGRCKIANGDYRAVIWQPNGNMQELDTEPGRYQSSAVGINDSGQVAGTSHDRAFIWDAANGLRYLSSDLGSLAEGINNQGQICGDYGWQKYLACTIGAAKKLRYDACVQINDLVVVGSKRDVGMFLESSNRCSGIMTDGPMDMPIGQRLSIQGVMRGDRIWVLGILNASDGDPLPPLMVSSSSLRPQPCDPELPWGLEMSGMLVRVVGKVTSVDAEQRLAYLDDGAAMRLDGASTRGIKVYVPEDAALPQLHSIVSVTGAGLAEQALTAEEMKIGFRIYPPGMPVRAISLACRNAADIITLKQPEGDQ